MCAIAQNTKNCNTAQDQKLCVLYSANIVPFTKLISIHLEIITINGFNILYYVCWYKHKYNFLYNVKKNMKKSDYNNFIFNKVIYIKPANIWIGEFVKEHGTNCVVMLPVHYTLYYQLFIMISLFVIN